MSEPSQRPLSDVRVLDLTRLLPGPFATFVLADLGATVDKIEDPGQGDYLRHMPPQVGGENVAFTMLNRGKRSAVLDLKKREGQEALRAILGSYDVLFEQFRPGVLSRLGLDPVALRKDHPRLVICSLTGYGQTGPLAHRAGHDLNYLARAGLLGAQGPAAGPPQVPGFQLADISGGMWSVIAILSALRHRDRTGEGAHLDIAMSEGTLPFMMTSLAPGLVGAPGERGNEQLTGGIAPYGVYPTKDQRYVAFAALEPKFWIAFCAMFDRSPSMQDLLPGEHQVELKAWVASVFSKKTLAEWVALNEAHDLLVEPVLSPAELADDPHLAARGILADTRREKEGVAPSLRTPVSGPPAEKGQNSEPHPRPSPRQGEHTRTILAQGGLGADAIDALFRAGTAR